MSDMFQYPLCNTQAAYGQQKASYPISCGGYLTWPCNAQFYGYQGNNIEYIHKYIVKYVQETPNCAWDFEREGIKLIQDESGKVTGVYAKGTDGTYYRYNCNKGVILCAGDFIGNPEMCWALLNEGMEWLSAAARPLTAGPLQHPQRPGPQDGLLGRRHDRAHPPWLDGHRRRRFRPLGHRSHADAEQPRQALHERGRHCADAGHLPASARRSGLLRHRRNWAKTLKAAPLDHGAPNFGMQDYWDKIEQDMNNTVSGQANTITIANLAERTQMAGTIYRADTLEELADLLGYKGAAKQNFLDSIAHYNELCYAGVDSDYGKDAPYMVPIDTAPFFGGTSSTGHSSNPMMVTMSGVITDETQNVLNKDWEPSRACMWLATAWAVVTALATALRSPATRSVWP